MKKLAVMLMIVLFLAGCAGRQLSQVEINAGAYPENYEQIIKDHLKEVLFDPDSLKDFSIDGKPVKIILSSGYPAFDLQKGQEVYEVKYVWYNAKNRMGGYTGKQAHIYQIRHGKVVAAF